MTETKPRILVLNGPNLNRLGSRQPELYGKKTLADIKAEVKTAARNAADIDFLQTNSESTLIDWVQDAAGTADALIINAAAYTHTSIALGDALKMLDIPIVEVHITNIHAREPFRHTSHVSPAATAIIAGLGTDGYRVALEAVLAMLGKTGKTA